MPPFVSGMLRLANVCERCRDTAVGSVPSLVVPIAVCLPVAVQTRWYGYGRSAREDVCTRSLDTARPLTLLPSGLVVACLLVAVMTTHCVCGRAVRNVASTRYTAIRKKLP